MTRHKEEGAAVTHVRVSIETKQLLHDLQKKHGFDTADEVLRYYLPSNVAENRPVFHSAREIRDLTYRHKPTNRIIKELARKYS
jgi:hypothetical protein